MKSILRLQSTHCVGLVSTLSLLSTSTRTECEEKDKSSTPSSSGTTKLLFLGSGSSTGCPKPICSLLFPPSLKDDDDDIDPTLKDLQKGMIEKCRVSKIASIGDPRYNKNYRNNPSLLISHRHSDGEENNDEKNKKLKNVIIDVGKVSELFL